MTFEEQLTFWKDHLRGVSTLELPTDRPRFAAQPFRSAVHSVHFSQGLTRALLTLSREEGATLFMTLLAAFQALLHRYTGQDDIVVGTPISNRDHAEIQGLIGVFKNTLVMRTDTSGDPTFRDLLQRVRQTVLDAYTHQDLPFEKLVRELQPEHDLSRNPLFQVMFTLQNMPLQSPQLPGLTPSRTDIQNGERRFDLELRVEETEGSLRCAFFYSTELFDAATIERMAGHYQRILEGIVVNPEQRLSELPLLTEAEQHRILNQWNDTGKDYPRDKCIHDLFEAQVEKTPDHTAVMFMDRKLTYRELNEKANQLARELRGNGVSAGSIVGIMVERSCEMIIGLLGILKAGGAYLPIDPGYPEERIRYMLEDSGATVLLVQKPGESSLLQAGNGRTVKTMQLDMNAIYSGDGLNLEKVSNPDDLAYVLYTSGSTGKPKGVMVEHASIINTLMFLQDKYPLLKNDTYLLKTTYSFDVSTAELFGWFFEGGRLAILEPEAEKEPNRILEAIKKYQVTHLNFVPSMLDVFLDVIKDKDIETLKGVKYVFAAGEALRSNLVRKSHSMIDGVRLENLYGPTETSIYGTGYSLQKSEEIPDVPIGKPISNMRAYILDKHLRMQPAGVAGELCLSGIGVARGYLNKPELTAEKFVVDPFVPGGRMYRTGDLAKWMDDGNIRFCGRIDHQVKIRGFRIELGEIEATIAQHPSVKGTVVIVREDRPGDKRLVAYIVLSGESAMMTEELRQFLKERLPDYMVPSAFVVMEALPLTPNGKIDRKALPVPDRFVSEKCFIAPRNTVESQLTWIWMKALGLQRIGITDNFFDLGGNSLIALRLISEVKKVAGKNLPVSALYQAPTIEQLGKMLDGKDRSVQWSSLTPIQTVGSKRPFYWTYGQESNALLSRYLDDDQPFYALHHQGADGKRVRYTAVEEIAAHYLKEVRTVQPEGPYLLGGYSFGAMVALEMAQKLYGEGEEVFLLFLLNPPENCFPSVDSRHTAPTKKETFRSRLVYHKEHLTPLPASDRLAYILRKLTSVFYWISARHWRPFMITIKKIICNMFHLCGYPLPVSLRTFYLLDIYYKAIRSYTPQGYPGKVALCHSDKVLYGSRSEISRFAAGGMDFYTVKGAEHLELIKEPYVGMWARYLKKCLDEVQEKGHKQS